MTQEVHDAIRAISRDLAEIHEKHAKLCRDIDRLLEVTEHEHEQTTER